MLSVNVILFLCCMTLTHVPNRDGPTAVSDDGCHDDKFDMQLPSMPGHLIFMPKL